MTCRRTTRSVAGVLAVSILAASRVGAQLPQKPENLQVLPKDLSTDSVVTIMRGFAMGLGVRCQFCHVERGPSAAPQPPGPGGGGPFQDFDFKADDKQNKKVARVMIRMLDSINTHFLPSI